MPFSPAPLGSLLGGRGIDVWIRERRRLPPPEHSSRFQVCSVVLGSLLHYRRPIPHLRRLLPRIHLQAGDNKVGWIDLQRCGNHRNGRDGDGAFRTFPRRGPLACQGCDYVFWFLMQIWISATSHNLGAWGVSENHPVRHLHARRVQAGGRAQKAWPGILEICILSTGEFS